MNLAKRNKSKGQLQNDSLTRLLTSFPRILQVMKSADQDVTPSISIIVHDTGLKNGFQNVLHKTEVAKIHLFLLVLKLQRPKLPMQLKMQ